MLGLTNTVPERSEWDSLTVPHSLRSGTASPAQFNDFAKMFVADSLLHTVVDRDRRHYFDGHAVEQDGLVVPLGNRIDGGLLQHRMPGQDIGRLHGSIRSDHN